MKRLFAITGAMLLLVGASTAFAECPTAEWVCDYWPPFLNYEPGIPTQWCEGEDCLEMNYNEGARLVAVDDEGPYPKMWHIWATGEVTNFSCENLRFLGAKKNVGHLSINMPDQLHCAMKLKADGSYLWFFASIPESCFGWVECQVSEPGQ